MNNRYATGRHGGVLVPLFSIPSSRSWGIGEIGDIPAFAAWLRSGGQDVLQLLPVNEMAGGQHSPYSAMSAMAIDPIFISMHTLEDFAATGGERSLPAADRDALARARAAPAVDYGTVRSVKDRALRASFSRFIDAEWRQQTPRATALAGFVQRERWWLAGYALYRTLHAQHEDRGWMAWPPELRRADLHALREAGRMAAREILYRQYLQWVADTQWREARRTAGVGIFGDLPFMVACDSADVWTRQAEFDLGASVGTPPDAFSQTGQDWGLPVYRWDRMAENGFGWLTERARRMASLYDGYRVDHVVGFYRTYARPRNGEPYFTPAEEPEQTTLGERLLRVFSAEGTHIIAEDLGTVPDFVRASLARLRVPGYKVLRWEREWHDPRQPFRDPAGYPAASVATTGTHDTETLAEWWDGAPPVERQLAGEIPALRERGGDLVTAPFGAALRDAILEMLVGSGSDLLLLPVQDLFGWRVRINEPGTLSENNWTWRLPWPAERLVDEPEARERAAALATMCHRHGRGVP